MPKPPPAWCAAAASSPSAWASTTWSCAPRPPAAADLLTKDLYVTFRTDLTEGEDAWLQRMDRKRRQMMNYVAKDKAGFTSRVAGIEELPALPPMFSGSTRPHPTPVICASSWKRSSTASPPPPTCSSWSTGRPVAGVLNLLFRDVIMPFYAGADRSVHPRGVDDYMYLSILRWGRENGFRTFDPGRSKRGTGAYAFKARWGMTEVPLAYQYHLVRATELPNVSPANPKYQALIEVWKRLPLPLTQILGPRIIGRIP